MKAISRFIDSRCIPISAIVLAGLLQTVSAQSIPVVNHSFEDVTGMTVFNEFTFGAPPGWELYDPNNLNAGNGFFPGTLINPELGFFDEPAPDGDRVAILFNSEQRDAGEYGFQQTLGVTLQANTTYELSVEVGDIGSGNATNDQFFDLSGFPGYRVEILADLNTNTIGEEVVLAADNDSLTIQERFFERSVVQLNVGAAHAQLGQALAIRLVNLNVTPAGANPVPDLEVDFDDVQFNIVPEPRHTAWLMAFAAVAGCLYRRNR